MKYFLQLFMISVLFLAIMAGCDQEEFFELERPPQFAWLTPEDMEFGIAAAYSKTFLSDWNNPVGNNYLIFTCLSEHVQLLPGTSADISYNELYNRITPDRLPETTPSFTRNYDAIGSSNALIDFFAEFNGLPFPAATQTQRSSMNRILGEAYFMRAFNLWSLAIRHLPKPGDPMFNSLSVLPQRLTFPESKEEAINVAYMTGTETFDLILADLDSAKKYLPLQYRSGIDDDSYEFGRANKYVAHALSMRVNFYLGGEADYANNWDNAIADADFIINSGLYALDEDPLTAWSNSETTTLGEEVIWYALFSDKIKGHSFKRPTSINYSHYLANEGNRGEVHNRCPWNQYTWSHSSLQEIGWFDENLNTTAEAFTDKRYLQLNWRLEGNRGLNDNATIYEMQYPGITEPQLWSDKYYRAPFGQHTNIPMFKFSEILLTRSVLNFRKGNVGQALIDLNEIRTRAGLSTLAQIEEEDIHKERLKELAFEADFVIYKISLQLPLKEGDRDPVENRNLVIEYPYEGLYFDINQSEIDFKELNKNEG